MRGRGCVRGGSGWLREAVPGGPGPTGGGPKGVPRGVLVTRGRWMQGRQGGESGLAQERSGTNAGRAGGGGVVCCRRCGAAVVGLHGLHQGCFFVLMAPCCCCCCCPAC